jgi:Lrp/AsnC family leucine-responsive transcriptional regulator
MNRLNYQNGSLDLADARILKILSENARTSTAEIGRRIGLSSPSTAERVRRLEEAGVIRGYRADIDPQALGYAASAWLSIRPVPGELARVAALLQDIPEITQCERVTGEDCFLAKVHVREVTDLETVIDRIIPYAMTRTSVIQSVKVEQRLPPVIPDD